MATVNPMMQYATGHAPAPAGGIGAIVARIVAVLLVAAAGIGGWIVLDQFVVTTAQPVTTLPELGDGLPAGRLSPPAPWRQFELVYASGAYEEHYWFDLDTQRLRSEVSSAGVVDAIEIEGDRGFRRSGAEAWIEQDAESTRNISRFLMGGIGPFLLTDLLPPDAIGFTSLELEGTSKGERVYEVEVDAATLQDQHPLAFQRWVASTRILGDGTGAFRIRVRDDGYIVRVDGHDASVSWIALDGDLAFASPLAAEPPLATGTAADPADPAVTSTRPDTVAATTAAD